MATHKEVTRGVTAISRAIAEIESTNIKLEFHRREDFQELQRSLIQAIEKGTKSGREVARRTNGLVGEREQPEDDRSEVLNKLADLRKLESATRAINSVAPIYREQMARYFEIATLAERPLLAMVYSYLDDIDESPAFAILLAQSEISFEQKRLRHDQLRRRLDGRSRGLLELVQCDNLVSSRAPREFFTYQVDFIHRTVRDFLHQSADVQSLLQHNLGTENFSLMTCHAILAVMKTAPFHQGTDIDQLLHLIRTLFFFASRSLAVNPVSEEALGPILDAAEASYRATTSSIDEQYETFLFIGHAARIDFFSYVHKKLVANPNMLRKARSDPGLAQSCPALYYALRPALYTHHVSARTVAYLLEAGADPNEVFGGDRTVWADFLFTLHISLKNEWVPHTHMDIIPDKEKSRELVRVLLLHGADLNAYVAVPHTSGLVKAETLIKRVLTPEVANQLLQEVRQASDQTRAPWNFRNLKRKGRWYQNLFRRSQS
ncbi:uncharacterized protein PG986_015080 [Apiospora aurea]|uniref:DUF7791 domain-containing protein n=1 Tax=Apiospora aurea TaxID=335848 RepID=A0ABR1PRJ2_9PEZI